MLLTTATMQHANLKQPQCYQWVNSWTRKSTFRQHSKLRLAMILAQWSWQVGEFPICFPSQEQIMKTQCLLLDKTSSPVKDVWGSQNFFYFVSGKICFIYCNKKKCDGELHCVVLKLMCPNVLLNKGISVLPQNSFGQVAYSDPCISGF